MSSGLYVALMLGIMAVLVVVIVPALFWRKCDECGVRNGIDAKECRGCAHPLPKD